MNNVPLITKELLLNEYIEKKKSMAQIASEYGVSTGLIFKRIHEYGIEARPKNQPETIQKLHDFMRGKPSPKRGTHMSEEQKRKLSVAKTGLYTRPSQYGGHKKKRTDGYIYIYCPNHERASKDGYVMEHQLVMENHLGRLLKDGEIVHHKNRIRDDNRIENLQLMTQSEHMRFHMTEIWKERKGGMAYQ